MSASNTRQERLNIPEWAWDTGAAEWHEGYLVWGYSQERGEWYFVNNDGDLEDAKVEADELLAQWDDVVRVSVERRQPFKEVYAKPPSVNPGRAANSAATLSDSSLFETWNDLSGDTQHELVHISWWNMRRGKWSPLAQRELPEAGVLDVDGQITRAGFKLEDFGSARMLPYENPRRNNPASASDLVSGLKF